MSSLARVLEELTESVENLKIQVNRGFFGPYRDASTLLENMNEHSSRFEVKA